jgi:hypothetical protein
MNSAPQRPQLYFSHAPLRSSLETLQTCLIGSAPPDNLYLESLGMLAAIELGQHGALQENTRGMLGAHIAQRVIDSESGHRS